jgi:hypothetical protein
VPPLVLPPELDEVTPDPPLEQQTNSASALATTANTKARNNVFLTTCIVIMGIPL